MLPYQRPSTLRPDPASLGRVPSVKVLDVASDAAVTIDPDDAGAWTHGDRVGFRQGFVLAFATCGDPFADGFVYDAQATVIDRGPEQRPTTTTTTTPTTTAPPLMSRRPPPPRRPVRPTR